MQQNGQMFTTTSTSTMMTYQAAAPTYSGPTVSLIPKTANCSQPVLSRAAAKDTTLGLRMRGTYVGFNGLSIEFYPDSAIVGCGRSVHAYPYTVRANGGEAGIKIEDPAHPLLLTIKADSELDPGQGQYEVRGRRITGSDDRRGFTFAPLNATCTLELLAAANAPPPPPAKPSSAPAPATLSSAGVTPAASSPPASAAARTAAAAGNAISSSTRVSAHHLEIRIRLPGIPMFCCATAWRPS